MNDAPIANGVHLNGNNDELNNSNAINASPDSPPIESPATPVNNSLASDVKNIKIDVDYNPGESDLRHEPIPMSVDEIDELRNASTETPPAPATIPIAPPKGSHLPPPGEILEDVKMAEEPASSQTDDVHMTDVEVPPAAPEGLLNGDAHPPNEEPSPTATTNSASLPAVSSSHNTVDSLPASSPYSNNNSPNDDDHDKPPPTKRARKHSDAEKASIANTATPPPASVSPAPNGKAPLPSTGPRTLSSAQYRFCTSTVRTLKKQKDSAPFLHPVDHVALNIPHYPTIIKHPTDFSTIERKLVSSNPTKPDPNMANPRYYHADEFIADVRLVFSNCLTFNGPEHPITQMGRRVEAIFDKQLKNMPPPEEMKPPVVKKPSTPPPPPPPPKKPVRKASTSVPVIRRTEDSVGRPKREIHPPPPKDLPYADAPKKARKVKAPKHDGTAEQLKFCDKMLKDLNKKIHYNIAHPFYEPVDWVKLEIPSYPKIIKRPMDLSTMRKKLEAGEYSTADKFHDDFKLMIRNCFTFNPAGTPVNQAGQELQRLFEEKWKNIPPLHSRDVSEDEEDEEDEEEPSGDDHARMIASMESQIENMNRTLEVLKKSKVKEKKEKRRKEKREKQVPVASTSKAVNKQSKAPGRKKTKKPVTDNDVLSFEQKKDLSDTITKLDSAKLEKVIQIIHEGVPEIRDSTEEIELEIDQLPTAVLTKLYNFVIRPMRPPPAKRSRTGKGTGTGGLKRKSMDEDVEAEKIRVLEERMALFSNPNGRTSASTSANHRPSAAHAADSDHSSDSSSDSDDSGSDSE